MTQLVIDLYPQNDVAGARLVRLTNQDYLAGTRPRVELNGTGAGKVVIHGDHAAVTATNFAKGNYAVYADLDASPTRTLATSLAADDKVDTTTAHGFAIHDRVEFIALTGGAGLAAGVVYWVVAVPTTTEFQVAAAKGGAVINFTTNITAGSVRRLEDVAGRFLDEGEFGAVSRNEAGGRILSFSGPGPLAYLARATLLNINYNPPVADPRYAPRSDGYWHWPIDQYGDILRRLILEGQAVASPVNPIPAVTYNFSSTLDSAGAAWSTFTGAFTIRVGANYLDVVAELIRLGLTILMTSGFELLAFQGSYGTNRASATFAAGKVRFEAGINIASDLRRAVHQSARRTHLLVSGTSPDPADMLLVANPNYSAPEAPRVGALDFGVTDDAAALTAAALRNMRERDASIAQATFPHIPGFDEAAGLYTPAWPGGIGHYWLGDTSTLHTGTGTYDFNEFAIRVAAINWTLRAGGDWDIEPELGTAYYSISSPSVSGGMPGAGASCKCLRLCDDEAGFIETGADWKVLEVTGSPDPTDWSLPGFDDSAWAFVATGFSEPAGITMAGLSTSAADYVPSQELLLRREFYIDVADLSGAAVVLKYAIDNGGIVYVNGVAVATLGTPYTAVGSHYTSDHATTLPRSAFQAGLNCVAIWAWNESAGSPGATPPGPTSASVYIEMLTHNLAGTDSTVARCGHYHRHVDTLGRDVAGQHPASAVSYDPTASGSAATDVQAAIDEAVAVGTRGIEALLRATGHGIYLAAAHDRALGTSPPKILWSLDGKAFTTLFGPLATDNASPTYAGDPTIVHWNGKWWLTHQFSTGSGRTRFTLWSSEDLVTWSEVTEVATGIGGIVEVYPGSWARNEDGSVYVDPSDGRPRFVLTATTGSVGTGPFVPYEIHPTNDAMTTWSSAAALTGDWPSSISDPFWIKKGSIWALWYKRNAAEQVTYATSATLTGTYVQQATGDWAGWGTKREAPSLVKLDDGRWRIYIQEYTTQTDGIFWSESDDDWATWTALVQVTTDFASDDTLGGLDVIFIPGMYDHERDPGAHAVAIAGSVVTAHSALTGLTSGDDHTQYQKESEKAAASGYASLDSGTKVPTAELGSGSASSATYLRGDQTWATPAGSAGVGPILISDTPSTPLIFADLIQNEAQTDLVYADT